MKIVHVIEGLDDSYGGPAKSVPYLAHYCRLNGAETHLLSTRYVGPDTNAVITEKILPWEVFDTTGPGRLRYSPGLRNRLIEICAVDRESTIVHVHNLWNYTSYASFKVCHELDIPLVISPRGSLFSWSLSQGRLRKKLAWALFQKRILDGSTIHATSEDEASTIAALGVGKRIVCVRNGVELSQGADHDICAAEAARALGLDPARRYALFLSRLHKKKGLELLFKAWADCPYRAEWQLLIAGETKDNRYLSELKSQVSALGLTDSVLFIGFADGDKKALLFAASELFVLPSFSENFGIAVAEALAGGLAVITTRETPWADVASEGAGWYIEINHRALASALSEALRLSPKDLERMGQIGRRLAARYDWNAIGKEMINVYAQISQVHHTTRLPA